MAHTSEERKEFGARLKGARNAAGYTLQQVAEILKDEGFKVSNKQAVGHWETGVGLPDVFILRRLAKLFHTSLDALAWEAAVSMEAMQFAVEYDQLSDGQKSTLRAVWLAFIKQGNGAGSIPAAPPASTSVPGGHPQKTETQAFPNDPPPRPPRIKENDSYARGQWTRRRTDTGELSQQYTGQERRKTK